MKKLTFTVVIEFEDKIVNDNEISQVADNIADAIVEKANGYGIAPDDSETYTKHVEVYSETTKTCARRDVF
jgi:hypothetical protein